MNILKIRWPLAFAVLGIVLFFSNTVLAYPDFISYGYTTCIVCHTNSLGGGPLTAYGKALFAQEIAARPFIPSSISDEELGEYSGLLPGVVLNHWLQPSIKYRGLSLTRSPGGSKEKSVWINMQTDVSIVSSTSNTNRTLLAITYNILPEPVDYYNNGEKVSGVSKEHYIRTFVTKSLLVQVGLMDKAYGIRTPDHTAYNRGLIGMGKDDQAHGIILHYMGSSWDAAFNYFVGNLSQNENFRQKGFSAIAESDWGEKHRIGASVADFKTSLESTQLLAVHDRYGLPNAKGSSLWIEAGLKRKISETSNEEKFGNYAIGQLMINLTRGYNFVTTFERSQEINSLNEPDRKKWGVGFLTFPFQRLEARVNITQESSTSPFLATEDLWALQGQIHASF
ncbi:hypothetical protein AZI86_17040 [Bdellovibrio bacteriovorus]|uniref:Uncharacterized protein n=1 Tax=Bdellovibrio bacteriovorus TaxID=959 RepID=A0A150WEG1_BDEBC|nr:hypothetical protein [Bdellovibrio bacteriovorus]KYG61419.1 hypothetical protein AZI86_17040 [Bdellovibrio bacteriovorus]